MTEKTISPVEPKLSTSSSQDPAVQLIAATPLNSSTQFKLPIREQDVASVQSVDLDLVIITLSGEKIILQQGALQAAVQPDSQIVFSNGSSITAADQVKKIGILKPVEGGSFRLRSADVQPAQADNVQGREFGIGQDVNDALKQMTETAEQVEKLLQSLSTVSASANDGRDAQAQGQGPGTGFKKASDVVANPLASPTPGSPPVPENTNTSEQSGKDRELRASSDYKVTAVTLLDATKTLDAVQPRQMMAEAPLQVVVKAPAAGSAEVKPQWADGVVQNTLLLSGAPTAVKAVYTLALGTTSVPADFKINGQSLVEKPLELVVKGGATQQLALTWKVAEDGVTVPKTDFQVLVKYYNAAGSVIETGGQTLSFSHGDFRSVSETYANDANGQPIFNLLARGVSYDIQGDDKLNDFINAGDGHDIVRGLGGNDAINGGRGDDTLIGGLGADTLDGGTGTNTASYSTSATGVTVHTASTEQSLNAGGEAQGDVLKNIQNLVGSDFADSLWGDSRANILSGGKGDDTLAGGSGADQLIGGEGNNTASYASAQAGMSASLLHPENNTEDAAGDQYTDIQNLLGSAQADTLTGDTNDNILTGGAGDDTLQGGVGLDTLDGGDGQDTASYSASTDAVKVSLQINAVNEGGDAQGDVLVNIEHLLGSAYDDQLTGNVQANKLSGGLGNDTLEGAGGADRLDGGAGTNTSSYAGSSQGVTVYLAADRQLENQGGDAQGDAFTNIQNLLGSAYADTLVGDEKNNSLSGGAGDDTLEGGAGGDVFDGGTGSNTVTYVHSAMGVSVYLGADQQIYNSGPDASGDTFKNIQNLIGTEKNDVLVGDAESNLLQGGGGDDVLEGGLGADTLQGGEGHDTVSYENATQGVTASLGSAVQNVAEAAGDIYTSIENLRGTQFNDSLTGDASDNTLQGLAGNDTLDGGGGINNLIGGTGDDTYVINNVADTIVENINEGKDQVSSSVTYTLGSNLENLTLTGSAKINGTGNGLANVITGNSADNTLDGAAGADTLVGGAGNDTYVVDDAGDVITENAGEGKDLVQSSFTYTLAANLENLTLTGNAAINGTGNADDNVIKGNNADNTLDGGAGNDNISGNDGNDKLLGGDGNDALDGGDGNDTLDGGAGDNKLTGGAGDDTYIVSNTTDSTAENAGQGTDEVQTSVTYVIGENIEKLTLTGTANIEGTGNSLDNTITGNSGNNALNGGEGKDTINGGAGNDTLDGGAGEDSLVGGAGDDTYSVDSTSDVIVEVANEGSDTVKSSATYTLGDNIENLTLNGSTAINGTGNSANNTITGNSAANTLDGGAGADTLVGGDGNDTYVVDNIRDVITEKLNEGIDQVQSAVTYTLADNIEKLTLTGTAAINGTGNSLGNTITGNSASNLLDGGAGADTLIGGAGDDTYVVDNLGDLVTENANEGMDLVQSLVIYTLSANVENLILSGSSAINGTGNTLGNAITGNSGANVLDGGSGADTLVGGAGDDTYVVENAGDVVTENPGEGSDTVQSAINYTLGANLEKLTLTGNATQGVGNDLANTIVGNNSSDSLSGGAGNDTMTGGTGNDTLDGGAGNDIMAGGTGNDVYVVDSLSDVVTENASAGIDTVQVSLDGYTLAVNVENLQLIGLATSAIGNAGDNALTGNNNSDSLSGGAGNDTLTGATGNDTLDGGTGNDSMIGGLGDDTYVVDSGSDSITENSSAGTDTVQSSISYLLSTNLENLTLTGTGVLTGTGNSVANSIQANNSGNTLSGLAGNDTLIGGTGNDIFIGGLGADSLTGGGGIDTASYASSSLSVTASLASGQGTQGDALGDTFSGITNLTGGSAADTLTGDSGNNYLIGNAGNDSLIGGDGNDTLDGGTGSDSMTGGSGNDTYFVDVVSGTPIDVIVEQLDEGTDTVQSSVNYTLGSHLENLTLSSSANAGNGNELDNTIIGSNVASTLNGMAGDDSITGGTGSDTLVGGLGDDTLDGGAGSDWVDYSTATNDMTVELKANDTSTLSFMINAVEQGTDTIKNIENIKTGAGKDNISATGTLGVANSIYVGAGDDTVNGGDGDNTLDGGTGNDSLTAGSGNDTIYAGEGDDTVSGGNGSNTIHGEAGNDKLSAGTGNDTIFGGAGNDSITGGGGNDSLVGGDGVDTLTGGTGSDTFDLATNNTSLAGDQAIGGGGGDTFIVNSSNLTASASTAVIQGAAGVIDTLQIKGTAGATIDLTILTNGAFTSIDKIDMAGDGVASTVQFNSASIKSLVDLSDAACVLKLALGGNDSYDIVAETGVYFTDTRNSTTFYADSTKLVQIAQVQYV